MLVRSCDKRLVRNVTVLPGEKCVPKNKLPVTEMTLRGVKPKHRRFEPRLRASKLKVDKTHGAFFDLVCVAVEANGLEC